MTPTQRFGPYLGMVATITMAIGCSSASPSEDLAAVAEAFPAPESWQLATQSEGNESLCLGADCAKVVWAWTTEDVPNRQGLAELFTAAGWAEMGFDGTCEPRANVQGAVPYCIATGTVEGAEVTLRAAGPTGSTYRVTLIVE